MKTLAELKAEVYNAIANDSTMQNYINGRLYWIGKISGKSTFPLITYMVMDESGIYSFESVSAEETTFQLNVYTDTTDIESMDNIIDRIKTLMHSIGYRLINAPIEFLDSDINKIVRPLRWEKFNV